MAAAKTAMGKQTVPKGSEYTGFTAVCASAVGKEWLSGIGKSAGATTEMERDNVIGTLSISGLLPSGLPLAERADLLDTAAAAAATVSTSLDARVPNLLLRRPSPRWK